MKLREKTDEQLIAEAFAIFNGGDGLDHWSYSSTSTPFAKNIIQYTFPQKIRSLTLLVGAACEQEITHGSSFHPSPITLLQETQTLSSRKCLFTFAF